MHVGAALHDRRKAAIGPDGDRLVFQPPASRRTTTEIVVWRWTCILGTGRWTTIAAAAPSLPAPTAAAALERQQVLVAFPHPRGRSWTTRDTSPAAIHRPYLDANNKLSKRWRSGDRAVGFADVRDKVRCPRRPPHLPDTVRGRSFAARRGRPAIRCWSRASATAKAHPLPPSSTSPPSDHAGLGTGSSAPTSQALRISGTNDRGPCVFLQGTSGTWGQWRVLSATRRWRTQWLAPVMRSLSVLETLPQPFTVSSTPGGVSAAPRHVVFVRRSRAAVNRAGGSNCDISRLPHGHSHPEEARPPAPFRRKRPPAEAGAAQGRDVEPWSSARPPVHPGWPTRPRSDSFPADDILANRRRHLAGGQVNPTKSCRAAYPHRFPAWSSSRRL